MSKAEKDKIRSIIQNQFNTIEALAEEIRALSKDGKEKELIKLAQLLEKISDDSLKIGYTISARAA